jgi:segregation and condensation protein B
MSDTPELKLIVEAALLAADEPLTINRIQQLFENITTEEGEDALLSHETKPEKEAIKEALDALNKDYSGRAVECVELASGYTLRVKQDYALWIAKLWDVKPARYTRAFLETLALIAYKQPITRSEIEQVRGVTVSSHIIKSLLEREWIKVVGHRDLPGKPAVLATTKSFLDYFNLKSLDELPDLQDIVDLDKAGDQLEMQLQEAIDEASNVVSIAPVKDRETPCQEKSDA